jgi:hypothetical protein
MISFGQSVSAVSPYMANRIRVFSERAGIEKRASTYLAMLQAPMTGLASNVADRADVSAVAILGYN